MTGLFAEWQPRYAERGIPTFPVREKRPAVRGYLKLGLGTSARLASKFPEVDAIGFALGKRSKIAVLDVDTHDERVLADALDRHGPTPIIIRSGSGNFQCWYRWNCEGRQIRPFGGKPIDVLGGGFTVAPPSHGKKSKYRFIEGGLDDIELLPVMRGLSAETSARKCPASLAHEDQQVGEGSRNTELWKYCMRAAQNCDHFGVLLNIANLRNQQFLAPLSDDEALKVAHSAWGYTERGDNRFGQHGVWLTTKQVNCQITEDQDGFLLLVYLRANNGPRSTFMVANGLAKTLGWTVKRLAGARNRLLAANIERVRAASSFGGPALYRWKPQSSRI
jgi:hypothetical protein